MPFSPSDLAWWQWLLCAVGAALSGVFFTWLAEDKDGGWFARLIGILGFLAALLCGIIGLVRFIKWIWNG
jgi:hypothetical protein